VQILLELRANFAYLLIPQALIEKENVSNIIARGGVAPLFFRKSMILMDFFCAFYKSMILIWLRVGGGNCGSRRFGAKSVQAALLGRALRQPHAELSTARSAYRPDSRKIGAN
jgi:hypothetical protein